MASRKRCDPRKKERLTRRRSSIGKTSRHAGVRVKGGCGRQADGTAGLSPVPEIPERFGPYGSCQTWKSSPVVRQARGASVERDHCSPQDDRTEGVGRHLPDWWWASKFHQTLEV